jgi:LPS O-antigen subunit length determinant protein (WzzB/FepE family)
VKNLVRWAARLYPAAWRERYGAEMEALLEDVGPGAGDLWDVARGAICMQMTSLSFWKILAGCAIAGVLAGGVWSAMLPARYVSTAVMRISPAPQTAAGEADVLRHLQQLQQAALSRSSLSSIIQRLGIYANERKTLPLEDIIQEMRSRDIRIHATNLRGQPAFAVEVANENPAAAQAAVRALVTSFVEQNVEIGKRPGKGVANVLEVVDPASLPSQPSGPSRIRVIGNGLGAGLFVGLVCGAIWSIVRRKERWSIGRIGGFAAAGMALGVTVALLIPDEFISTAVLRSPNGGKLQSTITQVLNDDSLATIVLQEHLYSGELSRSSMNDVVRKMREHVRVQLVHVALGQGEGTAAFTISFQYTDRFAAQRVTRDLVTRVIGPQSVTEILDPASDPVLPSSPNRLVIAELGTVAGILLGLAATRFRRPKLATA